jgi:hypothetical protein
MAVVCSNRLKVLLAAILHEREGHPADGEHDGRKQQAHPNPEGLPGFDLQVVGAQPSRKRCVATRAPPWYINSTSPTAMRPLTLRNMGDEKRHSKRD